MFGHKTIHIKSIHIPFTRSRNRKIWKLQEQKSTYKFCTDTPNVSRMLTDYAKDASNAMCRKLKLQLLNFCLDESEQIATYEIACCKVFVCFNYSTSFGSDNLSLFKNSSKEARLLRNDILSLKSNLPDLQTFI